MEQQIEDFIGYMREQKGCVERTCNLYMAHLEDFVECTKVKKAQEITTAHVSKFLKMLCKKKLKNGTRNHKLIALRRFLLWCLRNNIKTLFYDKVELATQKYDREPIQLLTEKELKTLLDIELGTAKDYRDKAMLELLFSTGLRVSELVALNYKQIDFVSGQFPVRGKGGKIRTVFMSARAKAAVYEYVGFCKDWLTNDSALFINTSNRGGKTERLSVRTVQMMIKERADWVGIKKKVTPHLIRHQFATHLLNGGVDIRIVQEALGHSSIMTTQLYTQISNTHLKKAHAGANLDLNEKDGKIK